MAHAIEQYLREAALRWTASRTLCKCFFSAIALFVLAPMSGDAALASDLNDSVTIKCTAIDGRGASHKLQSPSGAGSVGNARAYSQWTLDDEGMALADRVGLFWLRKPNAPAVLRVAIDGPVSKATHLLSITDDTVSAVMMTSDQDTTRTWTFTINFKREHVIATGLTSNSARMKSQVIVLSCTFDTEAANTDPEAQAADSWRRFLKEK